MTKASFLPYEKIDEQSYYKVLLETSGYKQIRSGKGFFLGRDIGVAQRIGLRPSYRKVFTIDLLAELPFALKAKPKMA